MRVVIVGSAGERRRLRDRLPAAIEVVGEFATVDAARASIAGAEAILIAANGQSGTIGATLTTSPRVLLTTRAASSNL